MRKVNPFAQHPFIAFWEMTQACQLACRHCRASAMPGRDPNELSTSEAKALIDDVVAMQCPVMVLTGGDPAERPDLVELVAYGHKTGLRMALTPSATPKITETLLHELKEAGLSRIAFSLDGNSADRHDGMRGVSGSYERTFALLRMASEIGLSTQINTTVTGDNLDEMASLATQVETLDIALWSVFLLVPTGRGSTLERPSPEAVEDILSWLGELSDRVSFDIKTTAAPQFRRVLLKRKSQDTRIVGLDARPDNHGDGIGRMHRGINDGQGVAFVSHQGDIYPSGFLPISCGNVRKQPLSTVYREHPLFASLRNSEALEGKCGLCEFRKVCGGSRARAFATTSNLLAEDPFCSYQPQVMREASA